MSYSPGLLLFSCSVTPYSLQPHGLQHARIPYPSSSPAACSNSRPMSQWWYPTHLILWCPLLLLPSIFPSIRVFSNESALHIRWPKYWSFRFSTVLPVDTPDWLPLGLTGLISLLSKGLSRVFPNCSSKASVLWWCSSFLMVELSHYMTPGKTIALTRWNFVSKVMSRLFNTLSRFVIDFLPRNKCLNFTAAITICRDFRGQENKVCHCFHFLPIYLPWSDGTGCRWS